jgi:hypothetical protein
VEVVHPIHHLNQEHQEVQVVVERDKVVLQVEQVHQVKEIMEEMVQDHLNLVEVEVELLLQEHQAQLQDLLEV